MTHLPNRATLMIASLLLAGCAGIQPSPDAEFIVSSQVLRPAEKTPPIGANNWGGIGAIEYAANNLVVNSGNEPMHWRNLHRAMKTGPDWFEIDGGGASWFDLWGSGLLSGAKLRIYRLVDAQGNALPKQGDYFDTAKAAKVKFVGEGKVAEAGSPGLPDGGWVANTYVQVRGNTLRGEPSAADSVGLVPGRAVYYVARAVNAKGEESPNSNEVSAVPGQAGGEGPLFAMSPNENGLSLAAGQDIWWTPFVSGGAKPLAFQAVGDLPAGLSLDAATGALSGKPSSVSSSTKVVLKVTDARGRSDTKTFVVKPPEGEGPKPAAPTGLKALADGSRIRLSWNPVPGAAGYRLYRSTAPAARQANRVFLAPGSPKVEDLDYIVVAKKWTDFSMDWVSPRVRSIGNPIDSPNWPWRADSSQVRFSLAPAAGPLPQGADFGETVLKAAARPGVTGPVRIDQFTMISPEIPGEGLWYGQLEPGKTYRAEFWLKGEGLGDGGRVVFSFGNGYPDLRAQWSVTGQWQRFRYDFVAPERPTGKWHFGQTLEFTAPGALYLDNARVFRMDSPADGAKPYVPNPTVLKELIASQPQDGPKGSHRIWFLSRDATMDSILSWHASSRVGVDWFTQIASSMEMTLPMGLTLTEQTGSSPETRMNPYLVLAHIVHTEEDWRNLVEYLAAPYDPGKDSAKSKPYAHRRYVQRGHGRPWTDTFKTIRIEFGNETWHNGVVTGDWLGFNRFGMVTQGGPEYGHFTRYLVEEMKKSPYWKPQGLDGKIRFVLGAFYNGDVNEQGEVSGYGEEALQKNPHASDLGHANYVGPKWETGEAAQTKFTDEGIQATLLSWVQGMEPSVKAWSRAQKALAGKGRMYDMVAYEGGPSGYTLPGSAPAEVVEVNERYGKSLAMAVAALDSWLGSYAYGYTEQMFLGYGQGQYWNSHTDFARGFRPYPGWLALTLRNRVGRGGLMQVSLVKAPQVTRGKESFAATAVYAMKEGKRWTVFLLSRRLAGDTQVDLTLPFAASSKAEEHRLAGDPRANNREAMNVKIETKPLDPAFVKGGKARVNLPAGSIIALVIHEK